MLIKQGNSELTKTVNKVHSDAVSAGKVVPVRFKGKSLLRKFFQGLSLPKISVPKISVPKISVPMRKRSNEVLQHERKESLNQHIIRAQRNIVFDQMLARGKYSPEPNAFDRGWMNLMNDIRGGEEGNYNSLTESLRKKINNSAQPNNKVVSSGITSDTKLSSAVTEPVAGNISDKQGSIGHYEITNELRRNATEQSYTTREISVKKEPLPYRERIAIATALKEKGLLDVSQEIPKEKPAVTSDVNEAETSSPSVSQESSNSTQEKRSSSSNEPQTVKKYSYNIGKRPRSGSSKSWLSSPLGRALSGVVGVIMAGAVGTVSYTATNPFQCSPSPTTGDSVSSVNLPSANARCKEQSLRAEIKAQLEADNKFNNSSVKNHNEGVRNRTSLSGEFIPTANLEQALEFHAKKTDSNLLAKVLKRELPTTQAKAGDEFFGPVTRNEKGRIRFLSTQRLQNADIDKRKVIMPGIQHVRAELDKLPKADQDQVIDRAFK
jgi:hypothetical protein